MCERTYVACRHCDTAADELRYINVYNQREHETCSVDSDGDPNPDGEWETGDETEHVESYYECPNCGSTISCKDDLDFECVPDDCECSECVEPEPENAADDHDPDELVLLIRTNDEVLLAGHLARIPELQLLCTVRTVNRLPVPRWRIAELFSGDGDIPRGIRADLTTEVQPHLRNWMLNYDEREIEHAGNH